MIPNERQERLLRECLELEDQIRQIDKQLIELREIREHLKMEQVGKAIEWKKRNLET